MKKRLLAILLSLMMVLSLLPVGVFAEDAQSTNVAEVGDQGYKTLAEAVKNADAGATITLLNDVELSSSLTISADKIITLDLNGKTLKQQGQVFDVYGDLTIKNGTIEMNSTSNQVAIWLNQTAKLTIESNATVSVLNQGFAVALYSDCTTAELTVKGTLKGGSGLTVNGNIVNTGNKVTIDGATIESVGHGIYQAGVSDTVIKNANIKGSTAIEVRAGNVTIENGTFTATATEYKCDPNGNGTTTEGAALAIAQHTTKKDIGVTIKGGTFNGIKALNESNPQNNDPAPQVDLKITDGAFNGDVSITDNKNTSISGGAFTDLANAVKYAADGATIKLAGDVNGQVVIPAGKNITLDLNGHKVTAPTNGRYDAIVNNGTLTVTDSKKTGEIYSSKNTGIGVGANSKTTIEYAKVTGQEGAIGGYKNTVGATVTIKDGVFTGIDNAVVIFNGSEREGTANEITIDGGTFNGTIQTNGYVACGIYAPWKDTITVNGGTFNITGGAGIVARGGQVIVTGGVFNTTGNVTGKVGDARVVVKCAAIVFDSAANYPGMDDNSKITVTGGYFKSDVDTVDTVLKTGDTNKRISISGGHFTTDPTAYLAKDMFVTKSNEDGYKYTVTDTKPLEAPVFVDEDTDAKVDTSVSPETTSAMSSVISKTEVSGVANAVNEDALLKKVNIDVTDDAVNKVDVEVKVNVKLTGGDLSDGAKDKTLTFEASPVATVKVNGTATGTPVSVSNKMLNGNPITVKLPLPTGFEPKQIKHTSADGSVEYFLNHSENGAGVFKIENGCAVFTITKFSTFELSGTQTYVAPVYTSAPITKKDVKFDDVDVNAYYAPAVKWAVENKITAGKTDKLFAPDDTCTRGEMITFLWNAAGKPAAKNTTNPFTDVNAGAFYYDAVLWAVSNGITSGTSDTTFSPDDTVNRAQVVAFLYNYANKPAAANSTFSDVAADAYYAPAVGWAAAQKITSGTGNNTFSPENDCTRAQIVTFLYNDLAK